MHVRRRMLATTLARSRATRSSAPRGRRQTQLDAHDAADGRRRGWQALQAAAQALLGDDFRLVPEFALSPAQGDEWANAVAASTAARCFAT